MSVAAVMSPNPSAVTELVRERGGEIAFSELLARLRGLGFSDAASRDIIWRLLAHGVVQFTPDRDRIRLAQRQKAR